MMLLGPAAADAGSPSRSDRLSTFYDHATYYRPSRLGDRVVETTPKKEATPKRDAQKTAPALRAATSNDTATPARIWHADSIYDHTTYYEPSDDEPALELELESEAGPPRSSDASNKQQADAEPVENTYGLPPLNRLTLDVRPPAALLQDEIKLPENQASEVFSTGPVGVVKSPLDMTYAWHAPVACHRPLYFEEINLERHGYSHIGCWQPLFSAVHFFGTLPKLPYLVAMEPPHQPIYTLGHYRPGSPVPFQCYHPPFRKDAAWFQAATTLLTITLIP